MVILYHTIMLVAATFLVHDSWLICDFLLVASSVFHVLEMQGFDFARHVVTGTSFMVLVYRYSTCKVNQSKSMLAFERWKHR